MVENLVQFGRHVFDIFLPDVVGIDELSGFVHEVVQSSTSSGGSDEGGIVNSATNESIDFVKKFRNLVVGTKVDDELVEGVEEGSEVANE